MTNIRDAALLGVANDTIERYRNRYQKFGYDARSLGWSNAEQQHYRFAQTLGASVELSGRSILDIGCGFGDYRDFLAREAQAIRSYQGWDVNPDLVAEATKRHAGDDRSSFAVRDFLADNLNEATKVGPVANVGVMLGVLNFNLSGKIDNYTYSELALRRAWELVDHVLIVDFLSTLCTPDYPAESAVFYHDPVSMLKLAFSLSPHVTLKHNYCPIPQREFMLFIERR